MAAGSRTRRAGRSHPGSPPRYSRLMRDSGAAGVGQSSWGPAVYAIVDGHMAAARLESQIHHTFGVGVTTHAGEFAPHGACVSSQKGGHT